jgi:hypothetical protein
MLQKYTSWITNILICFLLHFGYKGSSNFIATPLTAPLFALTDLICFASTRVSNILIYLMTLLEENVVAQ